MGKLARQEKICLVNKVTDHMFFPCRLKVSDSKVSFCTGTNLLFLNWATVS